LFYCFVSYSNNLPVLTKNIAVYLQRCSLDIVDQIN
jgi:hypothetical protein